MKVVYHPRCTEVYESDPAAAPGRMEAIVKELGGFEFIEPPSAGLDDIRLCHTPQHIGYVQRYGYVFEAAALAAAEVRAVSSHAGIQALVARIHPLPQTRIL